jgi:hypothetical protein
MVLAVAAFGRYVSLPHPLASTVFIGCPAGIGHFLNETAHDSIAGKSGQCG